MVKLSTDVLSHIAKLLPPKDQSRASRVSKRWSKVFTKSLAHPFKSGKILYSGKAMNHRRRMVVRTTAKSVWTIKLPCCMTTKDWPEGCQMANEFYRFYLTDISWCPEKPRRTKVCKYVACNVPRYHTVFNRRAWYLIN